jgi:carboxymethylenebutenolidase
VNDIQEYLVTEFIEEYEDGNLGREDLERRVHGILGRDDAVRVLARVPARPEPARRRPPAQVPICGGAGLHTEDVRIPVSGGELLAYLARPDDAGRRPGIIAIHENRGLVPHARDCARRLASAGYTVLAPDLLSRRGGTAAFPQQNDAIAALGQTDPEQNTRDLIVALDWLAAHPAADGGRLGVTGWCMGGGYTWRVATRAGTRIRAAVPWYGPNPSSGVANIGAPVFAIYGALDERINAGIDSIVQQMAAHGKPFEHTIYPNAQHAFNNDTNPERYNPEQAKIAWGDMLRFFERRL